MFFKFVWLIIGSKQLKTGLNLLQCYENAKSSLENMITNKTNIKISLLSNERCLIFLFSDLTELHKMQQTKDLNMSIWQLKTRISNKLVMSLTYKYKEMG